MSIYWRIAIVLSLCCWGRFVETSVRAGSVASTNSIDCAKLPEGFQFRTFNDTAGEHRYALFTPRQYDPARKWPVILFLHGAGEKGTDTNLLLSGMLAVALEKSPDLPFIVVFPQCEDLTGRALTGWLAEGGAAQRALKILDEVERDFSVDVDHRVLVGWSMGGYGAWSLAAAHPKKWSAVMTLAGGAIHDELSLAELAQAKTPVWAISAQGDPLIPYQRSEKLVQQLVQAGGRANFTLLPSDQHDICRQVFASPQVFEWMLHPDTVSPAAIELQAVTPLPARTQYFRCFVESHVIPDSLALRLGNAPFETLAPALPELLSSAPIAGKLANIERIVGDGPASMTVRLSDVSYRCDVTRIWAHGISGGRLGLEVDFEPLELTIGQTTLDSVRHQARTGPIRIQIGIHRPATLKIEVQPVVDAGELRLRLLRKSFSFSQGNWYIQPPAQVETHSDQFTSDQLVTGIVGSLYGGRQDLIDRILAVVPDLLQRAEDELRMREAPRLAKMLSPLPVLVPDLNVTPSQVRTDQQGVSVLCNLNVSVRRKTVPTPTGHVLDLHSISAGDQLQVGIALDAVTAISQMTVSQNMAQVNVLDISEDQFARLADPRFMTQIMSGLETVDPQLQLNTILRLLDPMVVSKSPGDELPAATRLTLQSSAVALDVFRQTEASASPEPVGRIVFSLSQPITIEPPVNRDTSDAAMQIRWAPECEVRFLRGESLAGSAIPVVQGQQFEAVFESAWSAWGQAHGQQEIPIVVGRLGPTWLRIESLRASDRELNLHLGVHPVPQGSESDVSVQAR